MGLDQFLITNSKIMSSAVNSSEPQDLKTQYGIVAEWCKANQIHKWFVDNVQYGKDDCGCYEVEPEQLEELLEAVNEVLGSTKLVKGRILCGYTYDHDMNRVYDVREGMVLEDTSVARRLLPTQEGFFFGNTNYDQYYWQNLEYTKGQLERILSVIQKDEKGWWRNHCKGEDDWILTLQYHASW